jgi:hypothetical protein
MVSISCILPTARDPYPIIGLPDMHIFQPTLRSLERQAFRDFELIIVDARYPEKRDWIESHKWGFPIKYVPPHPNHSFWLQRKRWNIAGMLNAAILHAEGELLVRVDDCSEFEHDFLKRFWDGYRSGYFPMAMHVRYRNGEPVVEGGRLVRDSRYQLVKAMGGRMIAYTSQYYGYSSVSLDAALKVNGWNELCDGQKGLEDVEFGERLVLAGYSGMFLLDVNLQVIEHEHEPIEGMESKLNHCNYGLIQYDRMRGLYRANEKPLKFEDCEWIRDEICPKCDIYHRCLKEDLKGRFYIEGEDFRLWLQNQNIFDLREERMK